MARLKAGDVAFLVESNRIIREVKVVNCSGGMYLIRFPNGGGIRVKEHRLFATEEEAKKSLPGYEEPKRKSPYEYM